MEHFMFCKRYKTKWRRGLEGAIERIGEKLGTSSNIKEILRVGMSRKAFRGKGWPSGVTQEYRELIRSQSAIGWEHLWYGRWSTSWVTVGHSRDVSKGIVRDRLRWMKGVITTMWWFMHERWKERGAASGRDQHNVRREELLSEIRKLLQEEGHMPLRYRFLFKPGLERLEKSTLIRMQYCVEKSGGIIKQWRTKEKARGKKTREREGTLGLT